MADGQVEEPVDERAEEPVFVDALFRQKRKKHHGEFRVVDAPLLEAPVADTHTHLEMLPDPAVALARAGVHDVQFVCTIVDVYEDVDTTFEKLAEWEFQGAISMHRIGPARCCGDPCPRVPHVRIAAGCHPHNAKHYDDALEALLRERLRDQRVAAIGEIGLDFHYDLSPRDVQREVFRRQLRLAHELGLPVALHVREAHDDALRILEEEGFPPAGVLLHCYNLDAATLAPWIERGCYVAFGGPATFKKADDVREAVRTVPADRLLTETDAPYMTPEPMRGMRCEPAHVIFTADVLAEVHGAVGPDERREFFASTMENARRLLDREPLPWQDVAAQKLGPSAQRREELRLA